MKKFICAVTAAALTTVTVSSCGSSNEDQISKKPADFTAATRVETPEVDPNEIIAELLDSGDSSSVSESEPQQDQGKVNEYGLHDQYFLDSYTNKFNQILAQKSFIADVNYYEEGDDGKWYFWYNQRNELNGKDRHIQYKDDPKAEEYSKDVYYLRDTKKHYCAYELNWEDFTFSVIPDIDAEYETTLLDAAIPSILFYGIDDLETAVYMGYSTNPENGLTLEQFMIDDVVYSFTYDANGILKDSRGGGRRAKVRSFEPSCPKIVLPDGFKFVT